jgi:hypothetical protein
MKRSLRFWVSGLATGCLFGALGVGLTTGCGKDEAPPPPAVDKGTLAPTQPIEPSPPKVPLSEGAKREKMIRELMIWPDGAGVSRDVMDDYRTCAAEMNATPRVRDAHGLAQFAWMTKCMTDMGWQVNPDANLHPDQR